jgi:TPR repeat protein
MAWIKNILGFLSAMALTYLLCDFFYPSHSFDPQNSPDHKKQTSPTSSVALENSPPLKKTRTFPKKPTHSTQHLLSLLRQESPKNLHAFFDYWQEQLPHEEISEEVYQALTASLSKMPDQDLTTLFNGLPSQCAAYFLPRVFERMAITEAERMYHLTQKMAVGIPALESAVFTQWAKTAPEQAMKALLADNYISAKVNNGSKIFKGWLSQDPAAALAWYTKTSNQSVDLLRYLRSDIRFTGTEIPKKISEAELTSAISSLNTISDQRDKTRAYQYLIQSVAMTDPAGARKLIDNVDNQSLKWSLETEVTTAEVLAQPDGIDEFIYEAGLSGPKKEEIAASATHKLLRKNPQEALKWAQTISDPIARDAAHKQYAHSQVTKDLPSIMALIKQTTSPYDQAALWSGVEKALPELNLSASPSDLKFINQQLEKIKTGN